MFKITVRGQSIECYGDICASDSIGYLTCSFDFSPEWNNLSKTAQFTQNEKTYSVLLEEDGCLIPAEIEDGMFSVSVFGVLPDNAKRITTLCAEVNMRKSGFVPDGEIPVPPTADLYSQLVKKVEDAVDGIPQKLSEFENDADFATTEEIPTKVSALENDADYATRSEIPKNLTQLENDADFATRDEIPQNLTQLENDADYATRTEIPQSVSQLENDAGYITEDHLSESGRASHIVFESANSSILMLDDTAQLPFDEINAPNGSMVSIYGKNLMPHVIVQSETNSNIGFLSKSLPAGVYTIKITHKNDSNIAQYINATVMYDSGNSFGGAKSMTYDKVSTNIVTFTLTESGKIWVYAYGEASFATDNIGKIATIQVEAGTQATEYEAYKQAQIITMPVSEMPTSYYPNTTVLCNDGCSVKYKADGTKAYKKTAPIESAIILQSPKSNVIKLDDTVAQAPFVDIDAPDGCAVSIYGKNLVKNAISSRLNADGTRQFWGFKTNSLPAGDYTIKLTFKDESDFPKYIYATAIYDNGDSFGNALYITSQIINNNPLKITLATSGYIWIFDALNNSLSSEASALDELDKISTIQVEAGTVATEYEQYKPPQTVTMPAASYLKPYLPNTTVVCNEGCSVKYIADGTKVYNKLLDRLAALESAAVNNI